MSKRKQKVEENKEEKKDLIKVEEPEKPTLEQEIERKQKKNISIFINRAILVFLIGIFSIIFALMNVTKSVIVNGVSIKGIDVSNLSMPEAKSKIEEALNIELNNSIKL